MTKASRPHPALALRSNTDSRHTAAIAVGLSLLLSQWATAAPTLQIQQAREALKASAQAYRTVPALKETFTHVVKGANMDREPKQMEIRLGPGTDASASDALIRAVAIGRRFFVSKSDAPGKYIERPFTGDFGNALVSIFGRGGSLFEPVQVAMRSGKEIDGWMEALRFNLLGTLQITGFARSEGESGQSFDQIRFAAENGRLEVRLDPQSHFLSFVHLSVELPGSAGKALVEITGRLTSEVVRDPSGIVVFDPGDRRAVADIADLDSENLPIGRRAPNFLLESTTGRRIELGDLSQRVVILDFWATWCVPCWRALRETQELAGCWCTASS